MRARLVAASGLATALATGSAAFAAAPWSAPQDVSARFVRVSQPSIAFGADGTALLSWTEHAPTPSGGDVLRTRFARRGPDGSVVQGGTLAGGLLTPPQVYGRNRSVVLRARQRTTPMGRVRIRLDAAFGTTARPLGGRFRRVADFQTIGDWEGPALAVATKGEVAVAWTEFRQGPRQSEDQGGHRVQVVFGRAGRGFGRPRTVAAYRYLNRDSQSVALAYGARGDLVMAYSIGPRTEGSRLAVAARVRRPGRSFGRAQVLGPRLENSSLAAATAPSGRAVVVWASQDGGEEVHSPWIVRAAIRPARGRFGRAVAIDPGDAPERAPKRLAVAVAPDGSATAAWSSVRGGGVELQFPVRTATASVTGGFGPITQLAETGLVGSVATAADGTTLLTWADRAPDYPSLEPERGDIFAALRPPGASALGPPETVSSPELYDTPPAAAAFDPRTGRPTAVWPTGDNAGSAWIQLATRSG